MKLTHLIFVALASCACQSASKAPPKVDAETVDITTRESTNSLLNDIREIDPSEELWLAYVGVENQSAVPLATTKNEIDRWVSEILVNARSNPETSMFRNISERQVSAGMRAAGIKRADDLTLRNPRTKFLEVIAEEASIPDYLMFGSFTAIDAGGAGAKRFRLSLQMMNSSTGEIVAERSGTFVKE